MAVAAGFILFVLIDRWPALPDGYRSTLAFLARGGHGYGAVASLSGLNLWALAPGDVVCSSCRLVGAGMYILVMTCLLGAGTAFVVKNAASTLVFVILTYLVGVTNLAFNLLLTGIHERYLFETFPCLMIGAIALRRAGLTSTRVVIAIAVLAAAYGGYVWTVLNAPTHGWNVPMLRQGLIVSLAALLVYLCFWWTRLPRVPLSAYDEQSFGIRVATP